MSDEITGRQLRVSFMRREPAPEQFLEEAAEHVLDALIERAQLVAFGPAVSVDFAENSIDVECTVAELQYEAASRRVADVVLAALAECEYRTTTDDTPYESVVAAGA